MRGWASLETSPPTAASSPLAPTRLSNLVFELRPGGWHDVQTEVAHVGRDSCRAP